MFELKQQINHYEQELINNQSMNEKDVNELISHLQDEIDNLSKKGLSEEESFWIARHRIGGTKELAIEYSKVNNTMVWRNRLLILLAGYFLFSLLPKLVNLLTIPIYIFDLDWMLFHTPFFSPDYSVPIPLFLLVFTIMGLLLYIVSREKDRLKINPRSVMRYKFVIPLLCMYVIAAFGGIWINFVMANNSPVILGLVSASGAVFTFVWNFFLFICLIIFVVLAFKSDNFKSMEKA